MRNLEAQLFLVGGVVVLLAVATYFNSRKIYLQGHQMAVGKAEVLAAIEAERAEVLDAIRKVQDTNQPEDLSELLNAVQGIYEASPVDVVVPDASEPVADGTGETSA